jgi:hypothetical protein
MSQDACLTPLTFERFVDYWFDELVTTEHEAIEEHLFACSSCARRAETWAVELHAVVEAGSELPRAFLTPEQLAEYGEKASVVDVTSDELSIDTSTHPIHVFRVSLDAKLVSELERLDVEYLKEGVPEPIFYVSSVPLESASNQYHFACHAHVLSAHGDATMRLIGTREGKQFTVLESTVHMNSQP